MHANNLDNQQWTTANLKGLVEAVLFITSKPISAKEIAETLDTLSDAVEDILLKLLHEYACRPDSALEIEDTEEGYILQVKQEFQPIVNRMLPMELSQAATRTLSAIALKAPIKQTDLIDWRGSGAYEHLQELLKHKLISKKRQGRSYMIDVTSTFRQYFKVEHSLQELQLKTLLQQANESDFATAVDINGLLEPS